MKRLFPVVLATSLLSLLICVLFADRVDDGFFAVAFYPAAFLISFLALCLGARGKSTGGKLTVGIFLALQWMRLVLLPAIGTVSGYFSEDTDYITHEAATTASWLFLWENVVATFVCYLILRFAKGGKAEVGIDSTNSPITGPEPEYQLAGNRWVYVLFILVAVVVYFLRGRGMYTFLSLELDKTRASQSETNVNLVISSVVGYGLNFIVILSCFFTYLQHRKTQKRSYIWLALVAGILRILIIPSSSESRLGVVYSMGALLLLLPLLFPQYKKMIIRSVLIAALLVVGLMTVYKVFRAFLYDSYYEALERGTTQFDAKMAASQIDIYFYGVRNVAKNIAISQHISLTASTFVNDIVRNTFGLNFFLGDKADLTIAKYNLYIYRGNATAGYLYSSASYGYVFFGVVLAPLATAANLLISFMIERILNRIRYMDVFYILAIVYVRFAASMFACFSFAWNYASRTIVIGILIIGGASLLKKHNHLELQDNRIGLPTIQRFP